MGESDSERVSLRAAGPCGQTEASKANRSATPMTVGGP